MLTGAILASSEKKHFLRVVKTYGRDSICFQSRDLRNLGNLALGAIASSDFGLGYAGHELCVGCEANRYMALH